MFACKAGERARESAKFGGGHGAFFHHVIEGLQGKAAEDGEVDWDELVRYVKKRVSKSVRDEIGDGATQSPTLNAGELSGEPPVLVKLSSSGGTKPKVDPPVVSKEPKKDPPAVVGDDPKPGDEIDIEIATGVKMRFCWVPPGEFYMGAAAGEEEAGNDEKPQRKVRITKGFWLGKHEVTQEEYEAVVGKNPSIFQKGKGLEDERFEGLTGAELKRLPVEYVSWYDAKGFFEKLKALKKPAEFAAYKVWFPTEAQWEYACRGESKGTAKTTPFQWGGTLNGTEANCKGTFPYGVKEEGNYLGRTAPAGSYAKLKPHPWGLTDMHGNVSEWCEDYYGDYKDVKSESGKEGWQLDPLQKIMQSEDCILIRGGSWRDYAVYCRSASRKWSAPGDPSSGVGRGKFKPSELVGFRACFRPE